jgi:hypothetical protein
MRGTFVDQGGLFSYIAPEVGCRRTAANIAKLPELLKRPQY